MHVAALKWQEAQFKKSLQTLARGEVLIDMDFSMNLTLRSRVELQSEHWTHHIVSLFDAGALSDIACIGVVGASVRAPCMISCCLGTIRVAQMHTRQLSWCYAIQSCSAQRVLQLINLTAARQCSDHTRWSYHSFVCVCFCGVQHCALLQLSTIVIPLTQMTTHA